LTEDECYNLCIRRGTLTPEERKIIENHALVSIKILRQLPFPKKLARVPDYAGGHHERLDGTGYPFGLTSAELPLQARIMALADVFEALTARDRPYKKPMKLSQAVKILGKMCRENHLDPELYHLFINSGLYLEYAQKELNKDQIDVSESAS
jgi:HD-GYP domain-containing protein (c-di-GMP phosphodiesterase class II)